MELHHVGIATTDADELAALFDSVFDTPVVHSERFDGLQVQFLDCGESYLEVLEPLEAGTIASYLDEQGQGIHHLAFRTPDIEAALAMARSNGIELVDEAPRPGAWGHDVAFLHPKSTGSVLIEFVEQE